MMGLAIGVGAAHLLYAIWSPPGGAGIRPLRGALDGLRFSRRLVCWPCEQLFRTDVPGRRRTAALALGGLLVLLFTSEPLSLVGPAVWPVVDGSKASLVSKAFGDVLSYLRLFALGLASIKLAEAFNGLAATAFESGGVGLLLGLLVLLVGHGINFAMGLMSGVVHGLRLNLIEFFNWSLPEEGEQFQAFRKKALKAAE